MALKPAAIVCLSALAALSKSQVPDTNVRGDIRLSYRSDNGGGNTLRWYDSLSRRSIVGLELGLEPGLRAYFAERLARIQGDGDPDSLDEAYVENKGEWRVGKQYLPFGRGRLMRESALAARSDTFLFLQVLPFKVAAVDDRSDRPRGIIGRVGLDQLGASFAIGDHFGTGAGVMADLRRPTEVQGIGHGFHRMFGADAAHKWGRTEITAEYLALRGPENASDIDHAAVEAGVLYHPKKNYRLSFTAAHAFSPDFNMFIFEAGAPVYHNFSLEGLARYRDGRLFDVGITLRAQF